MRFFSQIIAFVLLALWMPATQHCDLEALNVFATHDAAEAGNSSCCEKNGQCAHDDCEVLEGNLFKPSSDLLKVPAPDLLVCSYLFCLQFVSFEDRGQPATPVVAVDQPLGWVPTWHFVRRAAPLSRAPSILV